MSDSTNADIYPDLIEIEEQERKKRRMLRRLLDEQRQRKSHAVGINSMMGSSRSFVTSVDLSWAAEHIRFASELPIFNEYRDEHGFVKPDKRTQDLIQQRNLDWRRQIPMTLYLASRENHKFPPLLVVVTRPWVDDPDSDNWGSKGRALEDSLLYTPIDSNAEYVDLSFESGTGSILYAIDGQHRLMALRGLKDLVRDGHLHAKTDIGKERPGGRLEIDHIITMSRHRIGRSDIQKLLDERIGIELIPAVMAGETREEALRRLRTLFVHVNRNAAPLAKGELALLDEDDGFAVVARMTQMEHPLLGNRVKITKGQLSENARYLTTLETLTAICRVYLEHKFHNWKAHRLTPKMPFRPEWDELYDGKEALASFFDSLADLPSFDAVRHGTKASDFRKASDKGGRGHLLFRPMAQIALAGALGDLLGDGAPDATVYWSKVREADEDGKFRIDDRSLPWYGTAWDHIAGKMRRRMTDQKLVKRLFLHLLAGGTPDEEVRERLRRDFASARRVTADGDDARAIDRTGDVVDINQVKLPHPW